MSTKQQVSHSGVLGLSMTAVLLIALAVGCDAVVLPSDPADIGNVTILSAGENQSDAVPPIALVHDAETGREWEEPLSAADLNPPVGDLADSFAGQTEIEADLLEGPPSAGTAEEDKQSRADRIIGTDDRKLVSPATSYPWSAIGQFRCVFPNGKAFIGSGALVGRSHVLTAAHVIYSSANGGWAKEITFTPGKAGTSEPYGRAAWRRARVYTTRPPGTDGWRWDVGLVTLDRAVGDKTGWFGMWSRADSTFDNAWMNTAGYPGDKGGTYMYAVYGQTDYVRNDLVVHWLDTMGGQSGSPIWVSSNGNRYVVAVNCAECSWAGCRENYGAKMSTTIFNWILSAIKSDGG